MKWVQRLTWDTVSDLFMVTLITCYIGFLVYGLFFAPVIK